MMDLQRVSLSFLESYEHDSDALTNLCRTCLCKTDDEYTSIYSVLPWSQRDVCTGQKMIQQILNRELSKKQPQPQRICSKCIKKIRAISLFRNQCLDAENILSEFHKHIESKSLDSITNDYLFDENEEVEVKFLNMPDVFKTESISSNDLFEDEHLPELKPISPPLKRPRRSIPVQVPAVRKPVSKKKRKKSNDGDVDKYVNQLIEEDITASLKSLEKKYKKETIESGCLCEQCGMLVSLFKLFYQNQDGRARVIKPIAHNHPNDGYYYAVGKLIVNNVEKSKDVGLYKCFVEDDSNIHKSASLNIVNILGTQEPFIEITEPAGKYSLKVTTKIREVKWVVKYRGYPAPKLTWYDIHGDEIPWSTVVQKTCKYEAIQDKRRVTLKIRDVRVSDSVYYTLHADNGQIQKEQKFQLTVISMSKKRPVQLTNATSVSAACKSCKDLVTRLDIAEKQIKMLRLQLKEAKELNIRTRNEQVKYRDLYTNCVRGTNNNL